jgi:hypothetical protein
LIRRHSLPILPLAAVGLEWAREKLILKIVGEFAAYAGVPGVFWLLTHSLVTFPIMLPNKPSHLHIQTWTTTEITKRAAARRGP